VWIMVCDRLWMNVRERETKCGRLAVSSKPERDGALERVRTHSNTLRHTATHCCTLQHTAIYCSTLQHTAIYCKRGKGGNDLLSACTLERAREIELLCERLSLSARTSSLSLTLFKLLLSTRSQRESLCVRVPACLRVCLPACLPACLPSRGCAVTRARVYTQAQARERERKLERERENARSARSLFVFFGKPQ